MNLLAESYIDILRQCCKDEHACTVVAALIDGLLDEKRDFVQQVAAAAPDMLYVYDFRQHRYLYVNDQVSLLLGYAPEIVLDVLADRVADIVHPEDIVRVRQHHRHIIEANDSDRIYETEFRARHADGGWRWLHVREQVFGRDADGGVAQVIGLARDITEHRISHEELHYSENHYRQIVESSPNSIFTIDRRGNIRAWNRGSSKALKYDDTVIGQPYQRVIHPENRLRIRRMVARVLHNAEYFSNIDVTYQCSDGTLRHMITRLYPIMDDAGSVQECVFANTDVTFRTESESAVRASERKLRSIIEQSADGLALLDTAGNIVEWNTAYERITGLTCDAVLERPLRDVITMLLPDTDQAANMVLDIRQQLANSLHTTGHYRQIPLEYRIVLPDGAPRDLQTVMFPIELDSGTIFGCITRDITARKQAERDALELAKERERIAVLTDFLQSASHEFRTPLSVINTRLYLMARQLNPTDQQRHLDGIQEQVNAITALVNSLLAIARLDSQDTVLHQPTNIREVLQAACAPHEDQIAARRLHLTQTIPPDLPLIAADSDQLHLVFYELLDNAIRYTPEEGHIGIDVSRAGNRLQVRISDTGMGIPAAEIPHIFERFYRVDKSRTTRGFGLGLSIARKIVELHGGHIDVSSTPGAGSAFTVDLPV